MCSSECAKAGARPAAGEPRPLSELEREICELAGHLAAGMCRWLLLVGEFDRRRGWAADGILNCAQWLSWRCSVDLRTAREHVRVARRLTELPRVREAFASGELSYCKVRALTRAATAANEEGFVELARHATGAQLEKVVRGYRGAVAADAEWASRAYERRYLRVDFDEDGSVVLRGRLPAEDGALVLKALEAVREARDAGPSRPRGEGSGVLDGSAEPPGGWPDPSCGPVAEPEDSCGPVAEPEDSCGPVAEPEDSPGARRADALVALARAGLAGGLPDRAGGDPCELVVHVDAASLASERVHERCELEGGPTIAPETARRLGCDAALTRIIEQDGRPLSIGRRKRTVGPALRRALRSRDGGCRFPGCTHTRFLHAHHIHHWARGGPTTLENLVQLCSHHHRLVHEGGYQVEPAGSGGLRFRRPDGRQIPAVPPPAVGCGHALEHEHLARGLRVDQATIRPLSAGDRLDYGLAIECLLEKARRTRAP